MSKYTAICTIHNVAEQLKKKYSLVCCGSVCSILILKHPTEFESILQMMGGFCIVNALLWEIPEEFAVKDASFESGIFC